jgi:hypothetical protein
MDPLWISAIAPWLLTRQTALLLVSGFVVGIFSVIRKMRSLEGCSLRAIEIGNARSARFGRVRKGTTASHS